MTCLVENCDRPAKTRGWCGTHYTRWFRHGDPNINGNKHRRRRDVEERIHDRVSIEGDCWVWTGYCMPNGYGTIGIRRQHEYVHRAMWEIHNGPIPDGLLLHHVCERKPCCNPDHLRPVTPTEHAAFHLETITQAQRARRQAERQLQKEAR